MPTFSTSEPISATRTLSIGNAYFTVGDLDETVVKERPSDESKASDGRAAEQTSVEYTGEGCSSKLPNGVET